VVLLAAHSGRWSARPLAGAALLALVVLLAAAAALAVADLRRRAWVVGLAVAALASGTAAWVVAAAGLTPSRAAVLVALPVLTACAVSVPSVRSRVRALTARPVPGAWAPPAPRQPLPAPRTTYVQAPRR
jgi:hypothetical protein